jgi:hypothetical protein
MYKSKVGLFFIFSLILFSCNRNLTVIYFNDNSKTDDGEIFGDRISSFFITDKNIFIHKIHSKELRNELKTVSGSLKQTQPDLELDDSYYGYAFIQATHCLQIII